MKKQIYILFFSLFRKYNGKNETVVSHLVSQPLSVEANHIALQPQANNPCEKTKCDQLCLLAPKVSSPVGFTCKCRPGFRKGDDGQCIEKVNLYFCPKCVASTALGCVVEKIKKTKIILSQNATYSFFNVENEPIKQSKDLKSGSMPKKLVINSHMY